MRIACLLADGFEDLEAIGTVDLLRRGGIQVDLVSVFNKNVVKASHSTLVQPDLMFKKLDPANYDGLFIPGGKQAYVLREIKEVLDLAKTFASQDKWMLAICAGPSVYGKAGLLDGRKYTSFPGTEDCMPLGIRQHEKVVVDGKYITGIAAGAVYEFAFAILANLMGENVMQEVKKRIIYELE